MNGIQCLKFSNLGPLGNTKPAETVRSKIRLNFEAKISLPIVVYTIGYRTYKLPNTQTCNNTRCVKHTGFINRTGSQIFQESNTRVE